MREPAFEVFGACGICKDVFLLQLSWHPEKEGLLGYGTDDGRVGVYDLLARSVAFLVKASSQSYNLQLKNSEIFLPKIKLC